MDAHNEEMEVEIVSSVPYNPYGKIRRKFRDVERVPVSDSSDLHNPSWRNVMHGMHDPPVHMIQILLLSVLGLDNLGPGEKTRWETQFKYKGQRFLIRDSKFGWAIDSSAPKQIAITYANELHGLISRGVKALDTILQPVLEKEVEMGDFYLKNGYGQLNSIYKFYKTKVATAVADRKLWDEARNAAREKEGWDIRQDLEMLNKDFHYLGEISNYSFAMIIAFFSLQDCILDSFYAFQSDGEGLLEFTKGDRWREKFKQVFGSPVENFEQIYQGLLHARETYRNALSHGLTGKPSLMVLMPNVGLIPISVDYLNGTPHYGFSIVEEEDAVTMTKIFDSFIQYLSDNDPWRYYLLYLETGFPIPAMKSRLDDIKSKMTSYDQFKAHLENEVITAEGIANYDIT